MKIKSMFAASLIMFCLSAASFLVMRVYDSHIAALCAAGFGFVAIIVMIAPGLQGLLNNKTVKPKV